MGLKKFTDDDRTTDYTWTSESRSIEVLRAPIIWKLADVVPPRPERGPGRPGEFPPSVYVLFFLLAGTWGSHRAALSWMGSRRNWRYVRKRWKKQGVELPKHPPTRGQCLYNRDTHLAPRWRELIEVFEQHAAAQAPDHGMFSSGFRVTPNPPRNCVVFGDGTVPAMPMHKEVAKRRRANGERVDFDRHVEGGDHPVDGNKFYLHGARATGPDGSAALNRRLILGIDFVPPRGHGGEAGVAVQKLLALKERVPGMLGVRYDGAMRGVHIDALMKAGLSVVTPPHEGTAGRERFENVTCKRVVDSVTGARCGKTTELFKENGAVGVREVIVDKKVTELFVPLPRRVFARGNAPSMRWYAETTLPCGHTHLVRLTGDAADAKIGFNRAEHIRMHPPGTTAYDTTYGWRNDTESTHSQLDDWLYRGRMVAHTLERQALVILGFAVTINAMADWYVRRRGRPPAAAPAA